jgi:hypothetical protein
VTFVVWGHDSHPGSGARAEDKGERLYIRTKYTNAERIAVAPLPARLTNPM